MTNIGLNIEQIFAKKLTRNINGVVKAEQVDDESVFVELDEYVVTKELDRHFRSFFETYGPAVHGHNADLSGKVGVWVSGFFGSGKSHFIKILSYLLENKVVVKDGENRHAIEFFKDKITDAMLYGDIHSAVSKPTDVILFNIDSRANTDERENAILKVFLKVFNERVGYCADFPHIAHMERELDKRDQYQAFKDKFAELTKSTWSKERDAHDFYRDEMIEAFSAASGQSHESARQTIDQTEANFPLDIQNFCKWVKEYLDQSGDKNILFLVDEVGQFIGKNTQMMLKLQTITEVLGTVCGGRAWVVVTSQADIDAAIGNIDKQDGDDFSKIQGRFATRLQLSSSNTSEVIQKRLLEKTDQAREVLSELFAEKGDILRNQLSFDRTTTAALNGYSDAPSFVDNYPFIPYHYPLVQKVFESIRTKGATGKHLAMGERSLLDAFQSAAKQVKDNKLDVLIPFYCFYAPIESFLEPAVKRTIDQAIELDSLTNFDGNILKTLFLIRYVDSVKSTLDNLVTLSIDKIDADKITLKKDIEDSLNRLERQLLIARNADEYLFLTNEEKEIENEIRHTDVEPSEVSNKLASLVFDDILRRQTMYRYPLNKQDFRISRFCNGHPRDGSTLEDLVVKIVSPLDSTYDSYNHDQHCINYSLEAEGCVLVRLAENQRLWDGLTTLIKTERFLRQNAGQRPEQEYLLREKQMENSEREKRLRHDLEALFSDADIFAIGTKLPSKSSTPTAILEEAYKYIIENTFSKLNVLQPTPGDNVLRELQAVLTADDMAQLGLDLTATECNQEATREVEQFISLKNDRNEPVYLRDVVLHFIRRPYGWPDMEIVLLTARLALAGKISFTMHKSPLILKQAYEAFSGTKKRGEIRIQKIRQHDERQIKNAKALVKNIFNKTFLGSTEADLVELLKGELSTWNSQLKSFQSKSQTGHYPGGEEIEQGLVLIAGVLEQATNYGLIERLLDDASSLEGLAENYEDLDDFYNSQFATWQNLTKALNGTLQANRSALEKDVTAEKAFRELDVIHQLKSPYAKLKLIQPLIDSLESINEGLVKTKREHSLSRVEIRVNRVVDELDKINSPADLRNTVLRPLQLCKEQIQTTKSIPQIISQQMEADSLEDDAFELINKYIELQRNKAQEAEIDYKKAEGDGSNNLVAERPSKAQITPLAKRIVSISTASVFTGTFIETEEQVGEYLSKLREELLKAIQAGDRVRIK